jgi:hypothetical protein
LIDSGRIYLPATNSEDADFARLYDPTPLFSYIQQDNGALQPGLYLSTMSVERPTMEGKRWFIRTAYQDSQGYDTPPSYEVTWQNAKKLQFWNNSFRNYASIHQVKGIQDYTVYVSRCFGYCWIIGLTIDPDDEETPIEFSNFYPSLHHYHKQVAINESGLWRPFDDTQNWYDANYGDAEMPSLEEASERMAQAVEGVTLSTQRWSDEAQAIDLSDVLELGEDDLGDEEE